LREIQDEIGSREQAQMQQEVFSARANPYLPVDVGGKGSERVILNPLIHARHMVRRWIDVPRWNCYREDESDREHSGDECELKRAANWLEAFEHAVPRNCIRTLTAPPEEIAGNRNRPHDGERDSIDCVERAQGFGCDDEAETEERDFIYERVPPIVENGT
jgi:hypothetical protein